MGAAIPRPRPFPISGAIAGPFALAAAGAWLFWPAAVQMVGSWRTQDNASHGFLILPIVAYLVWADRRRILASYRCGATAAGLAAAAAVTVIYLGGRYMEIGFLPPLSLVLMIGAQVLYFGGWGVLRAAAFPYAFLFFMVPWPDLLVEFVGFPMQLLSAKYATMSVGLLGIGVSRSGVDIHLPRYTFAVDVPCSGMKTLIALLALAALMGYLARGAMWKRALVFASGVPIALAANVARIVVILLIAELAGAKAAEGFFHGASGVLVFVFALGGLLILARTLGLRGIADAGGARSVLHGEAQTPSPVTPPRPGAGLLHDRRALVMAVLLLGAAGAQQAALLPRVAPAYEGPRARALQVAAERIPLRIGGWRGRELGPFDDLSLKLVAPDAYINREYVGADGLPAHLAVIYGHRKTSFHSPGFCLLGGGWNIVAKSLVELRPASGGAPIAANQFVLMRQGHRAVVLYYYVAGKRTTPSWVAHQAYLAWDRLRGQAAAGALVRLTVPTGPQVRAATQRGAELLALLHPHLAQVVMERQSRVR